MTVPALTSSYGKQAVRLVKVTRAPDRDELRDLTVNVTLTGDLEPLYTRGDNSGVVATDTMRNVVYALARERPIEDVERFGLALVDHFLTTPRTRHARVRLIDHAWERIRFDGQEREHEHAFTRAAGGERTATASGSGDDREVIAGVAGLNLLKTAGSGWEGFLRDRYTTLPETRDRILATVLNAEWTYRDTSVRFDDTWQGVREQLMTTFTDHYSPSLQHTVYRMGAAVLERFPEIERIRLSAPNKHHLLVDLSPFGLDNDNEIFVATDQPYGLIEATVERDRAPVGQGQRGRDSLADGGGSRP